MLCEKCGCEILRECTCDTKTGNLVRMTQRLIVRGMVLLDYLIDGKIPKVWLVIKVNDKEMESKIVEPEVEKTDNGIKITFALPIEKAEMVKIYLVSKYGNEYFSTIDWVYDKKMEGVIQLGFNTESCAVIQYA